MLRAERSRIRIQIDETDFFDLLNVETGRFMGPTLLPVLWVPSLFPEVKRPECDVDLSPLSSAEVKNAWSCIYTPL